MSINIDRLEWKQCWKTHQNVFTSHNNPQTIFLGNNRISITQFFWVKCQKFILQYRMPLWTKLYIFPVPHFTTSSYHSPDRDTELSGGCVFSENCTELATTQSILVPSLTHYSASVTTWQSKTKGWYFEDGEQMQVLYSIFCF